MAKRKWTIALVVVICVTWVGLVAVAKWVQRDLNKDRPVIPVQMQMSAPAAELKVYWDVPGFSFRDQDNLTVTDKSLRGHVWIADFFFSQCTTACPVLTSKLILLQKKIKSTSMRFVSFSVDPQHDSPAVLKNYANLWEGDPSRWRLLSTDPSGLASVASGMKVTVAASGDKDNPILHSSDFMLVDAMGQVRGIYDSVDSDSLARLAHDAQSLDQTSLDQASTQARGKTTDSALTAVERGQKLFGSMGCLACHSQVRIAPPLQSLFGSQVRLDDGKMVWADEAYLHESIVNPNAKIVAGYLKTMPNYNTYLNDDQVGDLVAYVKSLSSNDSAGHGSATVVQELVVDPVCKMQVTKDPAGPKADYAGRTYYFCSGHCQEKFQKNPEKYALTKELLH